MKVLEIKVSSKWQEKRWVAKLKEKYFTVGMAGHIDHGKTTLTKALTNIDTDRLMEEKARGISIELGYAPIKTEKNIHVSIVDVPGHERFIRQMIAGVAGIDLVMMVIAADEGVMPQTKEHLEILSFLGIKQAIIVITKIDQVDDEMLDIVTLDITETLESSPFHEAQMFFVDSVSGKGLSELKQAIFEKLEQMDFRDRHGSFRMPIDQVFTVQGQGTIVRGTVYEGSVHKASSLVVLPLEKKVRARNIQVHHQDVEVAHAGQRTAINLGGANREDIERGDVLVSSDHFLVTDTIDVSIRFVDDLQFPVKQRAPVKMHVGTSEVMGKLVFFDRNVVQENVGEVLCQVRLEKEIVVRRGDRFILRRPTPVETIGGGWVIDPKGDTYRFGEKTVEMLQKKKEGSPKDLVTDALKDHFLLSVDELVQATSLDIDEVKQILKEDAIIPLPKGKYTLKLLVDRLGETILDQIVSYHEAYPMRLGMNKAEMIQSLDGSYPKIMMEYTIETFIEEERLKKVNQFIAKADFQPHLPKKWEKRMEEVIEDLHNDGLTVQKWEEYVNNSTISSQQGDELEVFLLQTNQAYRLTEDLIIHKTALEDAIKRLKENTEDSFSLNDAKEVWNISRKYLIPILELLDELGITKRHDSERYWG
nr:selenocysteine-specific translation elongation factor [Aquibacillus koreensis]